MDARSVIEDIANKFIAHAASPESRQQIDETKIDIRIEDLENAIQPLCEMTSRLRSLFEDSSISSFLPPLPLDILENINRPLLNAKEVEVLKKYHNKLEEQLSNWK